MILSIEDKHFIKDALNAVLKEDSKSERVQDPNLPSLSIWAKYQKYLIGVLGLFEASTKDEYERLAKVVTELELDSFSVDAHEALSVSKEKVESYCNRIIKKLGI